MAAGHEVGVHPTQPLAQLTEVRHEPDRAAADEDQPVGPRKLELVQLLLIQPGFHADLEGFRAAGGEHVGGGVDPVHVDEVVETVPTYRGEGRCFL